MKSFTLTVLSSALFAGTVALAQTPPPPPPPPEPPEMPAIPALPEGPGGPNIVFFRGPEMGFHQSLKPVLNAPYQAEADTTTTQHLADGNVIEKNHTTKMARDKQGRTWTEETVDHMGPWSSQDSGPKTLIFIFDPVAGYSYTLHPDTKTAERRASMASRKGPERGRNISEGKNVWFSAKGAGDAPQTIEYRTESQDSASAKTEKLGTQQVNGVAAQGKRTTHTIPANTIGNTLPIVDVNETWFSPDLQMVVQSKRTDPRFGDTTFDLKNIQRGDPPATLFQVPGDYAVKDARGFSAVMHKR